jgi:hypothetical protein
LNSSPAGDELTDKSMASLRHVFALSGCCGDVFRNWHGDCKSLSEETNGQDFMERAKTHPIFIVAGIAVLVFSLLGAAAVTGVVSSAVPAPTTTSAHS